MLDPGIERDLWLADAYARASEGEAGEKLVDDRPGERLQEVVLAALGDLADARRDQAVVDRVLQAVGERRLGHVQPDVEHERLALPALVLLGPVIGEELEPE